ncbi:MAG: dipeptidase [Phycisphaerales bacterium]|nr:dipeptidase [Phycisphaerales bacterium]MCB9863414.1 dipeptidase [Phycisphaerales bacterium]
MRPSDSVNKAIEYVNANSNRFVDELFDLLRIPSISAQPSHAPDVRRAAEWVASRCRTAGLSAEIVETKGHPAVLAQGEQTAGRPTVLVYGHYDVQPEGELSLWKTGPFEPVIEDGKIVCRGAADDKGQAFCAILAAEAWLKAVGSLPINLKFCLEGEEEVGSVHLEELIRAHRDRLACDYVLIHDTAQFDEGIPAVTTATKGLVYKEVILRGPKKDLHSGSFGGVVANPANVLSQLIATLHDEKGRVAIPGFYDAVVEMSAEEVRMMESLPFTDAAFLAELGSPKTCGEAGYSTLYRRWARPTLDVNGIYGGYMKEGSSTIIPASAGAKISMRLVAKQKAKDVSRAFDETIRSRVPDTVTCEILDHACCDAYLADVTSPGMQAARKAVAVGFGKEPVLIREGGSLPILPLLKEVLGADSLMLGYCLPGANIHSPNEFMHVRDFEAGIRSTTALLGLMAGD